MGTLEIVFIFVIYLLLFGAKGVPSLAQTLGKAVRQFREASNDIQREMLQTGREITQEMNRVKEQVDPLHSGAKPQKDKVDLTTPPSPEAPSNPENQVNKP